ncbi:globin [Deinococcus sp.]|uniref:globin domain-containing protein n=1 Tax=Deinococcus sp. TaxID=47478 RepID=UPI003C7DB7FC
MTSAFNPLSPELRGTLYERIGPDALRALLERFYTRVAADPLLAPVFPGSRDPALWAVTLDKQFAFLAGFLGGPPLYHQRYGNPMLRARHLPFAVTSARARAWLACMQGALKDTPEIEHSAAAELFMALSRVAQHMVNSEDGNGE